MLTSAVIGTNEYMSDYIDDEMVNDCLNDMYLYMICSNEFAEKKQQYFSKFENKYNKLNSEQQELVKQEYIKIIEAQDRNKVKRKGDKYE